MKSSSNPAFRDKAGERIRAMAARVDTIMREEFGDMQSSEAVMALAQLQLVTLFAAVDGERSEYLRMVERLHASLDLQGLALFPEEDPTPPA